MKAYYYLLQWTENGVNVNKMANLNKLYDIQMIMSSLKG